MIVTPFGTSTLPAVTPRRKIAIPARSLTSLFCDERFTVLAFTVTPPAGFLISIPKRPPPVMMLLLMVLTPTELFKPTTPMALSPPPVPISMVLLEILTPEALPSDNSIPQQLLLVTMLPVIVIFVFKPFQITIPRAPPPLFTAILFVMLTLFTGPFA